MITSLSDLTMRKYIELVCGDTSVLAQDGEIIGAAELEKTRRRLMGEYAALSDAAGAKAAISRHSAALKARAELVMFQCLRNALMLGAYDEVRDALKAYGFGRPMDNAKVAAEVDRLMKRARTAVKRLEAERDTSEEAAELTPDEIWARFDSQTASLMAYLKFQIDTDRMPASQYACLVDHANRQIKAQMAAMRK